MSRFSTESGFRHVECIVAEIFGLTLEEQNSGLVRIMPVGGGDINENYLLELPGAWFDSYRAAEAAGSNRSLPGSEKKSADLRSMPEGVGLHQGRCFLKLHRDAPLRFFEAEAEGLLAIRAVEGAPRVPEVYAVGRTGAVSYLLIEHIETAGRSGAGAAVQEKLGHQLATMHLGGKGSAYGFDRDNFIGRTAQVNTPTATWIEFYRNCRLVPLIRQASDRGLLERTLRGDLDRLLSRLDNLLEEPEAPALLHGDLWGGNWLAASDGSPVLIDPAVFYGDPEADIAMTELFGGFSSSFYRAYDELIPKRPGVEERKEIYRLYHLLNHLIMFGRSYAGSVAAIAARYAGSGSG